MPVPPVIRLLLPWLLLGAAAGGGYLVWRIFLHRSPTQQIEGLLERAAEAAGAESVLRLSGAFARDYRDDSGLDRAAILGQAQRFFGEVEELSVEIARVIHDEPELPPDAAAARAIVVLKVSGRETAGGQRFQGIAGDGADAFLVGFEKREGDWLVTRSRRLDATDPQALMEALRRE